MGDATFSVDVVMNLISDSTKSAAAVSTGIEKNVKALTSYGKNLNSIEQIYGRSKSKEYFNAIIEGGKFSAKELNAAKDATQGLNYAFLSLIFGGMAVQRVFGTVFNALMDGYKSFADENDAFLTGLTELSGAFDLLKFVIGDAFVNSPFVQAAIEGMLTGVNELADFFQDNESLAVSVTALALAGFLFGGALIFLGQAINAGMAITAFSKTISNNLAPMMTFFGSNPLVLALAVALLLLGAAVASFPELRTEVLDSFSALGPIIQQTIVDILNLIGFNSTLETAWQDLAIIGTAVFKVIAIAIYGVVQAVEVLVAAFDTVFAIPDAIGSVIGGWLTGDTFGGIQAAGGQFSDVASAWKNIIPTEAEKASLESLFDFSFMEGIGVTTDTATSSIDTATESTALLGESWFSLDTQAATTDATLQSFASTMEEGVSGTTVQAVSDIQALETAMISAAETAEQTSSRISSAFSGIGSAISGSALTTMR